MAFAETADLAVRLSLDDRFTTKIGRAQGALGRFSSSVGRIGKGTGQLAAGLARAGAVAATIAGAGLVGAAKAAIDFEDAFAGVKKTVNEADLLKVGLSFDKLATSFRKMATEMPIAATELARIGETAGALGIRAQDIESFTKTVALLSVTTNLTSDAAAEALGKVGTILGLTGQQFNEFADTLVNLGNQGASTESEIIEIAKRFAAAGRQAGISKEQILALSSAAASLGIEPEAAGGALSRIFSNMAAEIANGTKKGKEFARVTGDSLDELRRRINKGDALGILEDTLKRIAGLSRTEAASTLRALGISNVRDRDAILKLAQNLGFVNDQLNIAETSAGALGVEASKRFDTVASKIQVLKQNLIEAAIVVGEGFAPALGRAAEKLSKFLQQDANRAQLRALGEDIGKFIDGIDWDAVIRGGREFVGLLKDAGGFAIEVIKALNGLPKEVKALGLGLLGLNKLSGGLVGQGLTNIIGGLAGSLAKSLAAQIPIFGRAFVQPVFVTNLGPGGLGGGAGVAALGGGAGVAAGGGAAFLRVAGPAAVLGEVGFQVTSAINDGFVEASRSLFPGRDDLSKDLASALKSNQALFFPGLDALHNLDKLGAGIDELINGKPAEAADRQIGILGLIGAKLASIVTPGGGDTRSEGALIAQAIGELKSIQVANFRKADEVISSQKTNVFEFLKTQATGKPSPDAVVVAQNLVHSFEAGNSPWARDLGVMKNHLSNLETLEAAFRAEGDTKSANAIRTAIQQLKVKIAASQQDTTSTIAAGDTRSEAALINLSTATKDVPVQIKEKLSGVTRAVDRIPGAIKDNRPIVNVSTSTIVRVNVTARDVQRSVQQSAKYGHSIL